MERQIPATIIAAIEIAIDCENAKGTKTSDKTTVAMPTRRRLPFLLPV
jgi:hypothetical protein